MNPADPQPLWYDHAFAELDGHQLYRLLAARQAVFVVEQHCPYLDADGLDPQCRHLWAEDPGGTVLAVARLLPPGLKHPEASIGRVLTTAAGRGRGLARQLMQRALARLALDHPGAPILLEAQHYLEGFYRGLGFATTSAVFDLDGIPHVEMLRAG